MSGRRQFCLSATSLAGGFALAGAGLAGRAWAQTAPPVEGRDFKQLARAVAVPSDGKIHVIEFFWYGCPHCFAFEPVLEPWILQQGADVAFSRVPVGFDALKETHQRVYYTWEALGLVDVMHMKTFTRFNIQRKPVNDLESMVAFAQDSGLDVVKVRAAWNSFTVQTRCHQAGRLVQDYDISETPEMAIQGRFTATGAPRNLLETTDWLLNRVRHRA